jgi:hypothetical protein
LKIVEDYFRTLTLNDRHDKSIKPEPSTAYTTPIKTTPSKVNEKLSGRKDKVINSKKSYEIG